MSTLNVSDVFKRNPESRQVQYLSQRLLEALLRRG